MYNHSFDKLHITIDLAGIKLDFYLLYINLFVWPAENIRQK